MNPVRQYRERLVVAAMVFVLAVLSIAAALFEIRPESTVPLDSESAAPDGALALSSWLAELGHPVSREVTADFHIPPDTDVVFVLEPAFGSYFTEEDAEVLDAWISEGGTLVYAAENPGSRLVPEMFGFTVRYLSEPVESAAAAAAVFTAPPLTRALEADIAFIFEPRIDSFEPLIAVPEGPVVVRLPHGEGQVVLSATVFPFTNAGLKQPGSGALVLNLVPDRLQNASVWFDEWHHGKRPSLGEPAGPGAWLRTASAGRAVLFSAAVLFGWLALTGRAFGRPVPPSKPVDRRSPLEYVTAIANLNQRAGNRQALVSHYRNRLKRNIGRRLRIDPDLPDGEFLSRLRPVLLPEQYETVSRLLADMSRPDISENELVRLANESASQRFGPLTR